MGFSHFRPADVAGAKCNNTVPIHSNNTNIKALRHSTLLRLQSPLSPAAVAHNSNNLRDDRALTRKDCPSLPPSLSLSFLSSSSSSSSLLLLLLPVQCCCKPVRASRRWIKRSQSSTFVFQNRLGTRSKQQQQHAARTKRVFASTHTLLHHHHNNTNRRQKKKKKNHRRAFISPPQP